MITPSYCSEAGLADCPVCLGPFVDPMTCTVCGTLFCRQCIEDVVGLRCIRCRNTAFVTSTATDLSKQYIVNCNRCTWTGHVRDATTHQCVNLVSSFKETPDDKPRPRGLPTGTILESLDTSTPITTGIMKGIRPRTLLEANPVLASERVQVISLVHQLKRNNMDAAAWFHLGEVLEPNQSVDISGVVVNRVDCYKTALHLSPMNVDGWVGLGSSLQHTELVEVHGVLHNRRDCFEKALRVDDGHAHAWFLLACEIMPGEEVTLYEVGPIGGVQTKVSPFDCLRRSLTIDGRHAPSYAHLANILEFDEALSVNGDIVTAAKACRLALALDPGLGRAWEAAAKVMGPAEHFTLSDGTTVERSEALRKSKVLDGALALDFRRFL